MVEVKILSRHCPEDILYCLFTFFIDDLHIKDPIKGKKAVRKIKDVIIIILYQHLNAFRKQVICNCLALAKNPFYKSPSISILKFSDPPGDLLKMQPVFLPDFKVQNVLPLIL